MPRAAATSPGSCLRTPMLVLVPPSIRFPARTTTAPSGSMPSNFEPPGGALVVAVERRLAIAGAEVDASSGPPWLTGETAPH